MILIWHGDGVCDSGHSADVMNGGWIIGRGSGSESDSAETPLIVRYAMNGAPGQTFSISAAQSKHWASLIVADVSRELQDATLILIRPKPISSRNSSLTLAAS